VTPLVTPLSKNARISGFLYLLLVFAGPVRLIYIPSKLFVRGDAAATAANIAAHQTLFQFGIFTDLVGGTVLLFLTFALYRLFKDVDKNLAVLVIILGGVMPSAIYFLNVMNDAAALMLARGDDFLNVFGKPQRDALVLLFLRLHFQVIVGAEIFWGLWLYPLALLTIRSCFLPRFLGWWLIVNCFAYLALSFTGLLLPDYYDTVATYAFPAQLGEVAFVLWLLIRGVRA
jgi:hypothetical protein